MQKKFCLKTSTYKINFFAKSLKTNKTFFKKTLDNPSQKHYINSEDREAGMGGHGALILWFNVKPSAHTKIV